MTDLAQPLLCSRKPHLVDAPWNKAQGGVESAVHQIVPAFLTRKKCSPVSFHACKERWSGGACPEVSTTKREKRGRRL